MTLSIFPALSFIGFLLIVLIRFPKNREMAEKWNVALGFEAEKYIYGFVCVEHFEDDHFKRKNKSELKPHAVPMIRQNSSIEENQHYDVVELDVPIESIEPNEALMTNPSSTVELTSPDAVGVLDQSCITSITEHISDHLCASTPTVATVPTIKSPNSESHLIIQCNECTECVKKDYIINTQKLEIIHLRKKVNKANEKIWRIEKIRRKLNTPFTELKQKQFLNEELCSELEV